MKKNKGKDRKDEMNENVKKESEDMEKNKRGKRRKIYEYQHLLTQND